MNSEFRPRFFAGKFVVLSEMQDKGLKRDKRWRRGNIFSLSLLDCYPNVPLRMRTYGRLDIEVSSFFGFLYVAVANDANTGEINLTKPKTII